MHAHIADTGQMAALQAAFSSLPEPVMRNSDAYAAFVRGRVERVRLADLPGRTLAVAVVPHPPGIPLFMSGESAGPENSPGIAYLRALESFDREFPVFAHDIHGIERVDGFYEVFCVTE
jgi:arginine/lysine/ornithine decarboxylase